MSLRTPVLLASLALVACGPSAPAPAPGEPTWTDADRVGTTPDFYGKVPRNLLMISVDTFRRDHLDHYGAQGLTPFLSALAEDGFTLDDHTQCSNWTFAGVTCTLRGAYNEELGFIPSLTARDTQAVPDGSRFLATWLTQAGFYTILVSGNAWFGPAWGTAQGFHEKVNPAMGNAVGLYREGVNRLQAAIARQQADRWYLHLHLMEPHAPYNPAPAYLEGLEDLPPVPWDLSSKEQHYNATATWPAMSEEERALLEQHLRIRYEGEIRYWDTQLRAMLQEMTELGLLDDTLVVIWNDHGEQFWEHGYQSHAYTLHAEENDSWVLFWSNHIVPERWTAPTSAIDLTPTILSLFDLELPPEVTGLPVGQAANDRPRYATAVARLGVVQMVRKERYKLTHSWSGSAKFFDRIDDPEELEDQYDPGDPNVRDLWALMDAYGAMAEPLAPTFPRQPPPGL